MDLESCVINQGRIFNPCADRRWFAWMNRRQSSSTMHPLEDEDLLQEILLRLPPQPSSLPRASLVCTRWHRILSDPKFPHRFRKHHQKPPLLGFFLVVPLGNRTFTPILDRPDRIPATRFALPQGHDLPQDQWHFMGCRHGLTVLINAWQRQIVMWNPLTGQLRRVTFPQSIRYKHEIFCHATVLCADPEDGHVHGDCFLSPFKLVMVSVRDRETCACVYDSTSGVWGNILSIVTMSTNIFIRHNILVENAIYFHGGEILAFDLEKQSLGVIDMPSDVDLRDFGTSQLLRMEDGGLGLVVLSFLTIQLWQRKSDCGVVRWVLLQKTIELEDHLVPRRMGHDCIIVMVLIAGYDEEKILIVLSTTGGNFMLQVGSMKTRNICEGNLISDETFYPYTNFYTTV
ncbi:hypothetical protein VPH35_114362 [Triticum aestivum]|uniref:putative F-box/kelch-repeat protein At3g17280 n=1 Tax=Triticum aestivum TaxID=4565 RepID=UPI001D028917|nr:putative F-box/kelch-repeat protein At3g17280 [Triticum aestivum]